MGSIGFLTFGRPRLADSVAWIDVRIAKIVEAGNHWIVLCAVTDLAVTNPVSPLIFFRAGTAASCVRR